MHKCNYSSVILASVLVLVFLNSLVIVATSSRRKCATLYNAQSYGGRPYSLEDGDKQPSLSSMNFIPISAQVSPGCFLTVFDVFGYKQTLEKDMKSTLGRNSYRVLDAACCECDGCRGATNQLGDLCARLFENPRCDGCSGYRLDFKPGDAAKNFGALLNKMTSVAVNVGCVLTVFSQPNYDGWRFNFTEPNNMMGDNWVRQIASAKCGCGDNVPIRDEWYRVPATAPITLPTVPTRPPMTLPTVPTRPPMTLPTVRTTWPPMTLPTVQTRPPMTLPTVPTRPPMTLPTVPTRLPMTLPTVPTRPPMTLPTEPPTAAESIEVDFAPNSISEEDSSDEDDASYEDSEPDKDTFFYGGNESPEIFESTTEATTTTTTTTSTTTTTTTTPSPPTPSQSWSSNTWGFDDEEEKKDEDDKWDDDSDW